MSGQTYISTDITTELSLDDMRALHDEYLHNENAWFGEDYSGYEELALPSGEEEAYALIHALTEDVARLVELVMETRLIANWHSDTDEPVFAQVTDHVMEEDYLYLPAMDRYLELYGDDAVKLWDGAIDFEAYE
jgi:hypothetical protein